jgi:hypothetical protein
MSPADLSRTTTSRRGVLSSRAGWLNAEAIMVKLPTLPELYMWHFTSHVLPINHVWHLYPRDHS